jgi:homoserine dehydrogenase
MAPLLIKARAAGVHVVLANKLPLVDPLTQYQRLVGSAPGALRYEVTVGAGLPIVSTLQGLLASGDRAERIEGCFSGTLGYLFSRLQDGVRFSSAVREAWELGYTEPDPRDDLGGRDVARKALILARLVGCELELSQVEVEPLFSADMANMPVHDFVDQIAAMDEGYLERHTQAQRRGRVLRYVAEVSDDACSVGLMEVAEEGRLGSLRGPENMVVVHTARYSEVPLTIAGPGAGPEVTAAGVLSDILDVAQKG